MSKSLREQLLTTAKRNEKQRLANNKKIFLGEVQKRFDERLKKRKPWGEDNFGYEDFDLKPYQKSSVVEMCAMAETLGFQTRQEDGYFSIAIPMWEKGVKKTPAQLMLYNNNLKLSRAIKEYNEEQHKLAKEYCNRVLEDLKSGKFEEELRDEGYFAKVSISLVKYIQCESEIKRLMKIKGFERVSCLGGCCEVFLGE